MTEHDFENSYNKRNKNESLLCSLSDLEIIFIFTFNTPRGKEEEIVD